MSVDPIDILRLKASDFCSEWADKHPDASSRELVRTAMMHAYVAGALEGIKTVRQTLKEVRP